MKMNAYSIFQEYRSRYIVHNYKYTLFFYSTYIIRFCHVFVSNNQGRRPYNTLETLFRGYPQDHCKCRVNEVWAGVWFGFYFSLIILTQNLLQ